MKRYQIGKAGGKRRGDFILKGEEGSSPLRDWQLLKIPADFEWIRINKSKLKRPMAIGEVFRINLEASVKRGEGSCKASAWLQILNKISSVLFSIGSGGSACSETSYSESSGFFLLQGTEWE